MDARPIRVAHVLEATVGGTKRHLLDLALGLDRRRFVQHVFLSRVRDTASADDMIARLREGGVEVTVVPMVRAISPLADWRVLQELQEGVDAWQPDILHGHSSKGGMLARLVRSAARRVYTPHGFAFQMRVGRLRAALYAASERWAGRRTDALIALCESEKRLALERRIVAEARVRVIENGVNAPDIPRQPSLATGRPATIGTVGALTEQKDTRTLIRAMPQILREFPDAQLVVAGEGHLRAALEAEITRQGLNGAVRLLGQRSDVPAILAGLDVFVLPSLWEGYPYALLEAMAAGLACAGSAVPGIVDIISDGQTGVLFPPGLTSAVAAAVIGLLRTPERAARYATEARAIVLERNSIPRMVARTAELYEELCAQ